MESKDLAGFREKHFDEIEKTLMVAIQIRDDAKTPAKERVAAIREIGRLLGVALPKAGDKIGKNNGKPKIDPKHKKELDRILGL